jgi:hypothetical protein
MNFDEWKRATAKISFFKQSAQLKKVTDMYQVHEQRPTPASAANLQGAIRDWERYAQHGVEKTQIGPANVTALKNIADTKVSVSSGVKIIPVGYRIYAPGDAGYKLDGDTLLPADKRPPKLTAPQIQILNECIMRSKNAASLACAAMKKIAEKTALTAPLSADEQRFVEIFGVFDKTRAKKIHENFQAILSALTNPIIHDHRSTDFFAKKGEGYAAAHRGTATANVDLWIGHDIFLDRYKFDRTHQDTKNAFQTATDSTVGTLVHEFSHASINSVDVPPVKDDGNWELPPGADWESPNNNKQATGRKQVRLVASKEPRAALVAADCYGQFAAECLAATGK